MKRDSKFTYRRGAVLGDREGQLNLGSEIYLWGHQKARWGYSVVRVSSWHGKVPIAKSYMMGRLKLLKFLSSHWIWSELRQAELQIERSSGQVLGS